MFALFTWLASQQVLFSILFFYKYVLGSSSLVWQGYFGLTRLWAIDAPVMVPKIQYSCPSLVGSAQ
jgi:hypothetical protein